MSTVSGRRYGGISAEDRRQQQRDRLVSAAITLFGSQTYRATSVRMLCQEAGLTSRYFYSNFRDTEELLLAAYRRVIERIEAEIVGAISALPRPTEPDRMILAGLDALFGVFEHPAMARICLIEVLGVSPAVDQIYNGQIRYFADLLLGMADSLSRETAITPPGGADTVRRTMAIGLVGAICQTATQWCLDGYALPRETLVSVNRELIAAVGSRLAPAAP